MMTRLKVKKMQRVTFSMPVNLGEMAPASKPFAIICNWVAGCRTFVV